MLHDLTHSGLTHAVLMLDEGEYSAKNQTLLLCFAQKSVMFAIMTRPGVQQKYCREIEQRAAAIIKQWSIFEPHILIPTEEMVVSGRTSMTPGSTATGS